MPGNSNASEIKIFSTLNCFLLDDVTTRISEFTAAKGSDTVEQDGIMQTEKSAGFGEEGWYLILLKSSLLFWNW